MSRANTSSSSPPPAPPSPKNKPKTPSNKIPEGVFALHKPAGLSSAQCLRNLQTHFNPSRLFQPLIQADARSRANEGRSQKGRRSRAKRVDTQVKLGHGGTLDPAATGVLIVGLGKGTKELNRFLDCTKTYECVVLFGTATDTYDGEGAVVGRKPYEHVTQELVEEKLEMFRGRIMQKPPIYSALHVAGKRLYEYAREGKEVPVEIQEREMRVEKLELVEWLEGGSHGWRWPEKEAPKEEKVIAEKMIGLDENETEQMNGNKEDNASKRKRDRSEEEAVQETAMSKKAKRESLQPEMSGALKPMSAVEAESTPPRSQIKGHAEGESPKPPAARITMTVTSGFYVRSFCHDLGAAVDSLALMSNLVRSQQGEFSLEKGVLEFADLDKGEEHWGPKIKAMLDDWNTKYDTTRKARERSP